MVRFQHGSPPFLAGRLPAKKLEGKVPPLLDKNKSGFIFLVLVPLLNLSGGERNEKAGISGLAFPDNIGLGFAFCGVRIA